MKIKKGDKVIVIAGHEKGKEGVVTHSMPSKNMVIVEGLNKVTKHNKPNQQNTEGSITTMEAPIHVSNVKVIETEKKAKTVKTTEKKTTKKTTKKEVGENNE